MAFVAKFPRYHTITISQMYNSNFSQKFFPTHSRFINQPSSKSYGLRIGFHQCCSCWHNENNQEPSIFPKKGGFLPISNSHHSPLQIYIPLMFNKSAQMGESVCLWMRYLNLMMSCHRPSSVSNFHRHLINNVHNHDILIFMDLISIWA